MRRSGSVEVINVPESRMVDNDCLVVHVASADTVCLCTEKTMRSLRMARATSGASASAAR